ncbi:MAG: hypothetical protein K6F58_05005, partial [Bacteroidales bacterium]|nr:hypothetical protein [Bacteroidales bacterium]
MIAPMTRYNFILLKGEESGLLDNLQEMGLMDITRSAKPVDNASAERLAAIEDLNTLLRKLKAFKAPEGTAAACADSNSVKDGAACPKDGCDSNLSGAALAESVRDALTEYDRIGESLKSLSKETATLRVWGDYSPEMLRSLQDAGISLHFHCLSAMQFQSSWAADYALTVIDDSDKSHIWFVVTGTDDLPGEIAAPERPLSAAESELTDATSRKAALESRLKGLQARIPELEKMRDGLVSQLDLYLAGVSGNAVAEDYVLTFEGFAPKEKESEIAARLDALGVLYIKEDAKVEENPPIAFKNNAFVRMFEMLTDMYGRPAYNGFDPTPYISVFFMLFFAFCMGDCGYGLVLIIVALLLKKADAFKSLAPLVLTLGGATVIIGFLFHTFFSIDIANWSIFEPIKGVFLPSKIMGYDGTMVLSLLVGIFHICLALIVKTVMATKNQGFLGSLGTWGWTLLIVGGIIVGGISLAGVLSSEVTQWIIIVLGVLSGLGIFLLNDLHRNPLKNIGSGLWATYNTVTGLLGDVLSYLR